jgi:hypothetical protein
MPTNTPNPSEPHRSSADGANALSRLLQRPRGIVQSLNARAGLGTPWLIASFAIALLLILLREPSLFTRPQFWAEDGKLWYAQAYNGGWLHSLTLPVSGYLCTLPRLAAGAALLVSFRWAPLVMALEGLLVQALPVPILLSARCRNWAPLPFRLLFVAVYVGIPNAREIHVLCTNSLWHLAVIEVLLAFAAAPRSLFGRIFDVVVFVVAAVSGPFSLLLAPFLFAFWWFRRQRWSLILLSVLVACSLLQLGLLRNYKTVRHAWFLGATVARFIRIVGGDIFLGALRGSTPYGYKHSVLVCLVVLLIGLAVIAYCSRRASLEVRLFFLFCVCVLASSLYSPLVPLTPHPLPLWEAILRQPALRYWFFPSLILLWALLWCACYARSRVFRAGGILLALMLCQGIIRDWRILPLENLHFPEYAAQFEAAAPGTRMQIPLNPPPDWYMELTKK